MAILGGVWVLGSSLFVLTSLFMMGYAPYGRYVAFFGRFPLGSKEPSEQDVLLNVGLLTVGWPSVLILVILRYIARLPTAIGRWTRIRKDRRPLPKAKVES